MTTPWLVLVESNTSGTGRLFARTARKLGVRPILLADSPARYSYAAEEQLDVIEIDTSDEAAVLAACSELDGVAGITSSSEYYIHTAASVAQTLGLPGPPREAIAICRDKYAQRRCFKRAGVGTPDFRAVRSVEQAVNAARLLGFPVVVKPVSGTGSLGVTLCVGDREVEFHADALLQQRRNERGLTIPQQTLVEELAQGPEYSVETFGAAVIGITRKHLGPWPNFVEVGHDFPADVSPAVEQMIVQEVISATTALGLNWGPAHIELRVTPDGPKIIEVNPRLAGGYIPELVRLATGIDLIEETLRLTLGQEPQLSRKLQRTASIRFVLSPDEGVLDQWEGLDRARQVQGVEEVQAYATAGTHLSLRGDFRDRIGHVIASGETLAAATVAVVLASSLVHPVVCSPAAAAV